MDTANTLFFRKHNKIKDIEAIINSDNIIFIWVK